MDKAASWQVIDDERAGLADLLEGLDEEQWRVPTLCEGWTVRELAAHLSIGPRMPLGAILVEAVLAGGRFDRLVDNTARRKAALPREELVAELRAAVGSRRLAPGQKLVHAMLDVLVHGQDLAIPLGIERAMPLEAARVSAEHIWRSGFPFHARKRLRGFRLTAVDIDWSVGEGAEIQGTICALLLLVTGRYAVLPELAGPGTGALKARVGTLR